MATSLLPVRDVVRAHATVCLLECFGVSRRGVAAVLERELECGGGAGQFGGSSYYKRRVDALGPGAEEGRGARRNATGSGEHARIRGCPNAATPPPSWEEPLLWQRGNRGN